MEESDSHTSMPDTIFIHTCVYTWAHCICKWALWFLTCKTWSTCGLKVKVKVFLCMPCRYMGRGKGRAALILNYGTRWRWMVNLMPSLLYPLWVAARASWDVLEEQKISCFTRIWTPSHPACSPVAIMGYAVSYPSHLRYSWHTYQLKIN